MTTNIPTGKSAYEAIVTIIDGCRDDINKFYDKEINAPGIRLRKALKQIEDIIRNEKKNVVGVRNGRKV